MTTYRAQSTTPAIVVAAYNRPHSLRRILRSIGCAIFDQAVDLSNQPLANFDQVSKRSRVFGIGFQCLKIVADGAE